MSSFIGILSQLLFICNLEKINNYKKTKLNYVNLGHGTKQVQQNGPESPEASQQRKGA